MHLVGGSVRFAAPDGSVLSALEEFVDTGVSHELADHHRYGHCEGCTAAPVLSTPAALEALAA